VSTAQLPSRGKRRYLFLNRSAAAAAGQALFIFFSAVVAPTFFDARSQGTMKRETDHLLALQQGCQIFLGTKYQKGKNIPYYLELYQTSIKYNKRL
jgi:hypothetical protein